MAYSLLFHRFGSRVSKIAGVFGAAVVLADGGGCYTDPINMPPTVDIDVAASAPVLRGERASFVARVNDPNREFATLEWTHIVDDSYSCPRNVGAPQTWPTPEQWPRSALDRYEVLPQDTAGPFCLWAFARDGHGAVAADVERIDPMNRPPVAVIDIVEPASIPDRYPLYGDVKFSAAASTDAESATPLIIDSLRYQWELIRKPAGSLAMREQCDTEEFACLSPDVAGDYQIKLTVTDDREATAVAIRTISVAPDRLPCLKETTPNIDAALLAGKDPKKPMDFTVVFVDDDGDPYPAKAPAPGMADISWFLGRGTEPLTFQSNFPSFTIPADAFTIGDEARVRVEIHDRNVQAIDLALLGCGDMPVCQTSSGCLVRATWKIQY